MPGKKTEKADLEAALKEKVEPLLEEAMENQLGITIPKIEADITDKLRQPLLNVYLPSGLPFVKAKKIFKREFLKRELFEHQGNISELAERLDLDRRSIHRTIKDLGIRIKAIREKDPSHYREEMVDLTIRSTLEQYKEILQPKKMEQLYEEIPKLSRNIARFLPHEDLTWKQAESEFEKQFLEQALKDNNWNVGETARKIRIRAETLSRKVRKLGLKK